MLIDLHVHSNLSRCSELSLSDILRNGRARGLDGVCITDHDTTDVLAQIDEGFQPDGLLVLVGMEYTTPQGDFLVFGPVEQVPSRLNGVDLLAIVKELGGAVIAAHPFRSWRPTDISILAKSTCAAIEGVNGRNSDYENALASALASKIGLSRVAGSDAHSLKELGRYPTEFSMPVAGRADLVRALNSGLCQPSFAPHILTVAS